MTQDEIIEMARQVGFYGHSENFFDCTRKQIEAFAKLVAAKEREACAKVCEDLNLSQDSTWQVATLDCAEAIRARGEGMSNEHRCPECDSTEWDFANVGVPGYQCLECGTLYGLGKVDPSKPSYDEMLELWELCQKFIKEHSISCSESIYQTDRVIEDAYDFIDDICLIVGFEGYEDE